MFGQLLVVLLHVVSTRSPLESFLVLVTGNAGRPDLRTIFKLSLPYVIRVFQFWRPVVFVSINVTYPETFYYTTMF